MTRRPLFALSALLSACNVFDAQLYLQRQDAGSDAMAVPTLALADRCNDMNAVPAIIRTAGDYLIDTRSLGNDLSDLASCTGRALPGNDGFFRVRMEMGELWHFHVKVLDGAANPAIYVLPLCDDRACTGGLDECGDGRDEHISFRARESRDYFIGVDSAPAGGARYQLTVLRATCGNGVREHGESCDDNNRDPGDGCNASCQSELRGDNAAEVEPNDDFSDPNVIALDAPGSVTVQGRLGGRCDFDMYAINVPAGASVRATMLDVLGQPCGADTPEYRMNWLLPDGRTQAGAGVTTMANRCPSITEGEAFAQRVTTAGVYHIRVTTARDETTARDYKLRVELVGP